MNACKGSPTRVAHEKGKMIAQVALAWVLCQGGADAPIVGTTSTQAGTQAGRAVKVELSGSEQERLEEPHRYRCPIMNE